MQFQARLLLLAYVWSTFKLNSCTWALQRLFNPEGTVGSVSTELCSLIPPSRGRFYYCRQNQRGLLVYHLAELRPSFEREGALVA